MGSSRMGSHSRPLSRRSAAWVAIAIGWMLPTTGCQVEYAGMTLPSGKYMHDDVQYFPPGPSFPWANTQAATQRARMQAMGIDPGPAPGAGGPLNVTPAPGGLSPNQIGAGGEITDVNTDPNVTEPVNMPAPGGVVPPPGTPAATPPGGTGPTPGAPVPPPSGDIP